MFVSNVTSCQVTEANMSKTKPQIMFLLHSYKFNIQIDYCPICQSEMCPLFESKDPSSKSKDWKIRAESCSCWSQHRFCSWVQQRSTGCPWTPGAGGEHIIRKITGGEKDAKVHLTTMHNIFSKPLLSTQFLIQLHSSVMLNFFPLA